MRQRSRSAFAPRQRFVARRILASTQRLVGQAMARQWQRIPALMAERRSLLDELNPVHCDDRAASCAEALRAAVMESDRLLAGLVSEEARRPGD
jgi:hypothetical protein